VKGKRKASTGMNSSENSIYKVQLLAQPQSYLKKADKITKRRIATAIETISINPISGLNIKPLRGFNRKYRCRVGDIRIIYNIIVEEQLIIIEVIGPRGDVYKRL
jgi:mRNA interferase RelE/StbE